MTDASPPREIPEILDYIRRHQRFLCTGHVRSDGDALGSQLAMNRLLQKMGKQTHVVCDRGVSAEYRFLPGADQVGADPEDLHGRYDVALVFDTGNYERLERLQARMSEINPYIINIDHHASNVRFGSLNWIDPTSSSTGEMVYRIIQSSGVPLDREMSTCIYVALVTDTGRFSFSNTTVQSHQVAADLVAHGVQPGEINNVLFRNKNFAQLKLMARVIDHVEFSPDRKIAWVALTPELLNGCGFVPNETQEYIDAIKSVQGVDVAVLFREGDEPRTTKVSLRTSGNVNGVTLAQRFDGGGHPRAAGCTVRQEIGQAVPLVIREFAKLTVSQEA